MSTRAAVKGAVLGISIFLAGSCGSNSPTTPTTDFITLDSIVPAAGTTLNAGERVTFTAVVTCTLVSADTGFTGLVLQDQLNRSLIPAGESPPVANLVKGTATVTLSQAITIPATGSTVTAAFPIFLSTSNRTAAVVTRTYPVR